MKQNAIIRTFVASKRNYLLFKRVFDILVSSLVILVLLSWITPLLALLIRFDSKGPVFFVQKRVGLGGKYFRCFKFRTMHRNEEADERQAAENDERITRIGRFLRRTNLDELPQFVNVWLGQMSVIGPRPHMIADCIRFSFIISSYHFRNLVRPGITGLAQINGYHGATPDYESIVIRYYWDAQYIRKASFWLDTRILLVTVFQEIKNILKMTRVAFRKRKTTLVKNMTELKETSSVSG